MRTMRFLACVVVLLVPAVLVAVATEDKKETGKKKDKDDVIVITIKEKGGKSKYDPADVTVTVGQTVKWVNNSNTTHTVTSDAKVKDKFLFNTEDIDEGKSKSITFDKQKYDDAGGKDGKPVPIPYHCEYHPKMKAKLTLKPAAEKKDKDK